MAVEKIPEGFNTITPTLTVTDAAKAIDLYVKGFGAKEVYRMTSPNSNKVMHACIEIGNSKVFLADVNPEMGCAAPTNSTFYIYVDDVDTTFKKATQAGLEKFSDVQDMFWGDRTGAVKDPFGNLWSIATHMRDVSEQEMNEAVKKFSAKSKAA